ncbi:alpha/beta fold hydrolase [Pseudomonas maumuensis]|uniref:Alpha/beta hydrolase n=1 Tax=Pseudomonas maumuensis TaxID=2842354 RepID=A0ABX8NFU5_9PSED|nr:alpha/beta hydrolase [Pseudomonas maumuensis]QXH54641.1 alpha/beta hydrolase [Pseudomonas maumuensis]
MKAIAASVMSLLFAAGCATNKNDSAIDDVNSQTNTIYIDKNGELLNPETGKKVSESKDFLEVDRAERKYISGIISGFKSANEKAKGQSKTLRLTLFVHGGLNVFDGATERARKFSRDMIKDGQYPVFICWDSGPFTNYFDHLFRIRKGLSRPVLGGVSSPFVFVEDAARSVSRIPAATYKEIADTVIVAKGVETVDERNYKLRAAELDHQHFSVHSREPYTGVGNAYWTVWNPVKFLTAPFLDGLGTGAWDSMLRRADLVLTKKQAYEGELPASKSSDGDDKQDVPRYADTAATKLLAEWARDSSLKDVKINIIGHSMGAIVSTDILVRHPRLNVDNIVFMGAAARIKDVENVIVPWMQSANHKEARFYNLSLDPYREIGENVYYDFLPRGSLLNWIDFIFGSVNSYKDRTAGSWWNIVRTAEDIFPGGDPQLRQRVHLTRFPIGGPEMGPQTHGGFGEYCFWRSSFWKNTGRQLKHPQCAGRPE